MLPIVPKDSFLNEVETVGEKVHFSPIIWCFKENVLYQGLTELEHHVLSENSNR